MVEIGACSRSPQSTDTPAAGNLQAVESRTGAVAVVALDDLDRKLIEALQEDGRASFRRIAKAIGVVEATVRSRYHRLIAANALQVTAITNPAVLGFEAISMVGVRTAHSPREVADVVISWPEATYVVITSGQFDLLIELVCRDRPHLLDLLARLRSVDGVAQTETFVYFELSKQLYNWGARVDDHAEPSNGHGR